MARAHAVRSYRRRRVSSEKVVPGQTRCSGFSGDRRRRDARQLVHPAGGEADRVSRVALLFPALLLLLVPLLALLGLACAVDDGWRGRPRGAGDFAGAHRVGAAGADRRTWRGRRDRGRLVAIDAGGKP